MVITKIVCVSHDGRLVTRFYQSGHCTICLRALKIECGHVKTTLYTMTSVSTGKALLDLAIR